MEKPEPVPDAVSGEVGNRDGVGEGLVLLHRRIGAGVVNFVRQQHGLAALVGPGRIAADPVGATGWNRGKAGGPFHGLCLDLHAETIGDALQHFGIGADDLAIANGHHRHVAGRCHGDVAGFRGLQFRSIGLAAQDRRRGQHGGATS
jgi:hypothetical protein